MRKRSQLWIWAAFAAAGLGMEAVALRTGKIPPATHFLVKITGHETRYELAGEATFAAVLAWLAWHVASYQGTPGQQKTPTTAAEVFATSSPASPPASA